MAGLLYRLFKRIYNKIYFIYSNLLTMFCFNINGVIYSTFRSVGVPILDINPASRCQLGRDLVMVNNARFSTLGKNSKCKFVISAGATLTLGNNVAMSNTVIVATQSISVGNNILIGGGVTIVDSDFHSFNPNHWHTNEDEKNMRSAPVVIKDNVFIGMNTIVLKGVTIGSNVIIAAGSVVSKSIPDNEVWGGNPARFIKKNIVYN